MAELARAKLAGTGATVLVGDAAEPPVGERRFDVVLARHLLWALPGPERVLRRWTGLLRPGGRLVLVEGRWGESDPVGLPAAELSRLAGPLTTRGSSSSRRTAPCGAARCPTSAMSSSRSEPGCPSPS